MYVSALYLNTGPAIKFIEHHDAKNLHKNNNKPTGHHYLNHLTLHKASLGHGVMWYRDR
jgi:hypothetical protein